MYHSAVGFGYENPFEETCNSRMKAKGLIIYDHRKDLAVFMPQYPYSSIFKLTRKSNA